MSRESGSNLLAFLVGGLMGAGLALLFAPRSGRETREQIREYAKDLESKVKDQVEDVKKYTSEEIDKLKDRAKSAVEHGKKAFKEELHKSQNDEA